MYRLRLWNAATRHEILQFNLNNLEVVDSFKQWDWPDDKYAFRFYPSSKHVVCCAFNCHTGSAVYVWNTIKRQEDAVLYLGNSSSAKCVALSVSTQRFVTGHADGCLQIWDLTTSSVLLKFQHGDEVTCVDFSPDGSLVASGGSDRAVCLWNLCTGLRQIELKGHNASVSSVRFDADGTRVASSSRDGSIRIWHLLPPTVGQDHKDQKADSLSTLDTTLISYEPRVLTLLAFELQVCSLHCSTVLFARFEHDVAAVIFSFVEVHSQYYIQLAGRTPKSNIDSLGKAKQGESTTSKRRTARCRQPEEHKVQAVSLVEQVGLLEQQVLGEVSSSGALVPRLVALEKMIIGQPQAGSIPQRVTQLQSMI
jgi:WD40 repeat protein